MDVEAGIRELGQAYGKIETAMTDCQAAKQEVESLVKTIENGFEHPASFAFHFAQSLFVNRKDIFAEMNAAVADWKSQQYTESGKQIGMALAKLSAPTTAVLSSSTPKTKVEVTLDLFQGTLIGYFNSTTGLPNLHECASDSTDAFDEIEAAIKDIQKKTAMDVEAGIRELGQAYGKIETAMTDCQAAKQEVESLVKTIENGFEHPASFAFHFAQSLFVNRKDIFAEVNAAVADWKSQQYTESGKQIGMALAKLTSGMDFMSWKIRHGKHYS